MSFGKWPRDDSELAKSLPATKEEIDAMFPETRKSLLADVAWFLASEKANDAKPLDPACRFHSGTGAP
ncbi:hypothetical protein AB9F26_03065 [Falsihalocynthiibacter sp. BN13B15]|uniref:hypothetical protein n=1 Tax=Falsihalocynthiibacter sp. BN13B15 TaxID=3240871 RepID=UPI0035105CDB